MDIQGPMVPFKNQTPWRSQCLLLDQQHPPRMRIYIFFFLPCYIFHYINYRTMWKYSGRFQIQGNRPHGLNIIWNCVLSRTARLYTVITHNVPGKAICVPILWFDSLYLNNLQLKLDLCDKYIQPTNKLKIRILSETSIPHLIRHASFILIASLYL